MGLLLIAAADPLIAHFHLVEEEGVFGEELKSAYLVAFGLILHDFPEGFAMANSYNHAPAFGILIALAIGLHNIPEEFAMCVPLVPLEDRALMYKLAFLSGLSEPAGALVGLIAVDVMPALNPLFMAFAAGAMIYVSGHELVPMARRYGNMRLFGLGLLLSGITYAGLVLVTASIAS
ncbi:MAG: ZIP family metal transporter [Halobacteriota archaeon]